VNEEKRYKARVAHKHKTEADWYLDVYTAADSTTKRSDPFIPLNGELIIFDPDVANTKRRFKFGDGITDVIELPFITSDLPLEAGAGENSIQQNGATAIGDASIATGSNNYAGTFAFELDLETLRKSYTEKTDSGIYDEQETYPLIHKESTKTVLEDIATILQQPGAIVNYSIDFIELYLKDPTNPDSY
jgi:hypothetical protein